MLHLPTDPTDADLEFEYSALRHQGRSPDRRRRIVLWTGVAAVVLVAGALAVRAANRFADGAASPVTGLIDHPSVPAAEFNVIGYDSSLHVPGILAAAGNTAQLSEIWSKFRMSQPLPTVDFSHLVVVAMTIADNACPPTLTGFDEEQQHEFTPVFVEPEKQGTCFDPLIPKTYVVSIERTTVGSAFTLRLPAGYAMQAEDQHLIVDVGADAVATT